jgi:hypothetical protein
VAHTSPLVYLCLDEELACIVVFTGSWSTLFDPTQSRSATYPFFTESPGQ